MSTTMNSGHKVDIAPVGSAFHPERSGPAVGPNTADHRNFTAAAAADSFIRGLPKAGDMAAFTPFLSRMVMDASQRGPEEAVRGDLERGMNVPNAIAKAFRDNTRHYQTNDPQMHQPRELPDPMTTEGSEFLAKSMGMAKSNLDIGTLTNFAQITGGQSLGYVSLDTRFARGTVRPDSYTLYQALPKSAAYQVVDYWAYVDDPGGPLPGAAYQGFTAASTGSLSTDAGIYTLQNITLKLALDGRAVTAALMAQNNFVDVVAQENANAALTVLNSVNWANYWGNPTFYPNQQLGLASTIPTANVYDFQAFFSANASLQGWSVSQALYNMIYEVAAVTTSWGRYGRITHAFMTPVANGSLQGLVTTVLNNIVTTVSREQREMPGIVVDGDLQGMRTRMGTIQFPLDMFITARDMPAQAQTRSNGTSPATLTAPTPPVTVVTALSGAAAVGGNWGVGTGSPYVSGAPFYQYAVASTDALGNESILTGATAVSGITATGAYVLTITPPGDSSAINYRVYRSGLGYHVAAGSISPTAFRYIGTVAASGAAAVTYADLNTYIPSSETIFLLDMAEADGALDYRFLLPLTRIELFAQNLYMPWAVAMIGSIRNRIPKFHAMIKNYVPDNPNWNPLAVNS